MDNKKVIFMSFEDVNFIIIHFQIRLN